MYAGLDRPWDRAANALFASRAVISARDLGRAAAARDHVLATLHAVDDPWLHVRGEAMLGEFARIEQRFDDAVAHLARAAETSRRLGFAQTEAYQVSNLGRAQCQAGDYDAGAATLALAVEKAEATGDVRLAALVRIHLGRVLRALGRRAEARVTLEATVAWHRGGRGGEQAPLGEVLLAAEDAHAATPPPTPTPTPRSALSRSSLRRAATPTRRSRSSRSMRLRELLRILRKQRRCKRRPTHACATPHTSSPSATASTASRRHARGPWLDSRLGRRRICACRPLR